MTIQIQTKKLKSFLYYGLFLVPTVLIIIVVIFGFINNMNNTKSIELSNLQLFVQDLAKQKQFYTELVGLNVIEESERHAKLGSGRTVVIELLQEQDYTYEASRDAGLYHSALVYETRAQLSATISGIFSKRMDLYQGSSDHGATEAFYFADPEGNGVELYFDKPLGEVAFDTEGKPIMQSVYIDQSLYIQAHLDVNDSDPVIKIGHIHLKVGNIEKAREFYVDVLNFDIMSQNAQTLFISKDNYHHHLGMNNWESPNAGKRLPLKYGLKSFNINYLDKSLFDNVINNIGTASFEVKKLSETEYSVEDPWRNIIVLKLV